MMTFQKVDRSKLLPMVKRFVVNIFVAQVEHEKQLTKNGTLHKVKQPLSSKYIT